MNSFSIIRSSDLPMIGTITRKEFHKRVIGEQVANIPQPDKSPVYIATGGGYGSFDTLIEYLKSTGEIDPRIPSIKGEVFRDLPEFAVEKEALREAIQKTIPLEILAANPGKTEEVLRAFYSDEVNTQITKEIVKEAIRAKKSVIHESASIYPDTMERRALAAENGVETILIAGDKDHNAAIKSAKGTHAPFNTATTYREFLRLFQEKYEKAFDKIFLFNTDGNTPVLIAKKEKKDAPLEILDEKLYGQFIARKHIEPPRYSETIPDITMKDNERVFGMGRGKSNVVIRTVEPHLL